MSISTDHYPSGSPAHPDHQEGGEPVALRFSYHSGMSRGLWGRLFRELPGFVLLALVMAILIKTFLLQAFFIPSSSMFPTLEIDDRVLVSKIAYQFYGPQPGEVIVFDSPFMADRPQETLWEQGVRNVLEAVGVRTAGVEDLIKRVIAVSGDRLEIRDNKVLVNGIPLDEPYLTAEYRMEDRASIYVPDDHVWVMGDNRDNSQDSRWFGPVPVEDVVGRAFVRLWPVSRWGGL